MLCPRGGVCQASTSAPVNAVDGRAQKIGVHCGVHLIQFLIIGHIASRVTRAGDAASIPTILNLSQSTTKLVIPLFTPWTRDVLGSNQGVPTKQICRASFVSSKNPFATGGNSCYPSVRHAGSS